MKIIIFILGFIVGVLLTWLVYGFWAFDRTYGTIFVDRRDKNKFIFQLEYTRDPVTIPRSAKYIIFKLREAELKSIEPEDLK